MRWTSSLRDSPVVRLILTLTATVIFRVDAGEVIESRIDTQGDHYLLHIDMRIHAESQRVYRLLTDYAYLHQLSRTITESKLLYHQPPRARVRIVTEGCIGVFCRKVVQVQDVIEHGRGYIIVRVLPELSDIRYSQNLWHIRAGQVGYTRVTYSSDMVPDFWIPPLIGTALFKQQLLQETQQMIEGLEHLANLPERPSGPVATTDPRQE